MMSDGTLLCFFPEANLTEAFALELMMAQAAKELFGEVKILGCSRDLQPLCAAMSAEGITLESSDRARKRVCASCMRLRRSAQRQTDLDWSYLKEFRESRDEEQAADLCAGVSPENCSDLSVHGIPVGRYATYVPLLLAKADRVDRDEKTWNSYLVELNTIIRVVLMSERALDEIQPTAVLTSNHFYGTHRAFLATARNRGIPSWGLSPGALLPGRTKSALLFPDEKSGQTLALSESVRVSRDHPLTDVELDLVASHMRALREGSDPWVYSVAHTGTSPAQVRSKLGVRDASSVVTVLLSSPDEMRAANVADADFRVGDRAGYLNPDGFLASVLSCAELMPQVDFVLRLHPRMLPNKRESITSPELDRILHALRDVPDNVTVCNPAQSVSIYDNILISKAAINYTSSSGLEFLSFGVPVLHLDDLRLGAYSADLGTSVADPAGLTQAVSEALAEEWSLARVTAVARWWSTVLIRIGVFPYGTHESLGQQRYVGQLADRPSPPKWGVVNLFPSALKRPLEPWHMAWVRRRFRFPNPEVEAIRELQFALASTTADEVWEPVPIVRGRVLEDETAAVLEALRTAVVQLGWHRLSEEDLHRVGTVASLIRQVEEDA